MDIKEYVIKQLGRVKNKPRESYVVTRVIHKLDDLEIKFVTQQYVSRPNGVWALTDLYFPQFGVHLEVDEEHHFSEEAVVKDKVREADIVNVTNHQIVRINVTGDQSLQDINLAIDQLIKLIKSLKNDAISKDDFTPWDIEAELNPQTYINRGYIKLDDDVAFRTIKDACNCFGHDYVGYQRAGASHPDPAILLWFPKLYENKEWDNSISADECEITERCKIPERAALHFDEHVNQRGKYKSVRIVFARVVGSLGDVLYRFRGQYELDFAASSPEKGLIWRRVSTRVSTYPQPI